MSSESWSPAPYGQACEACARAKCKCFYRASPETGCERCHRRGIACRQSLHTRKRKARAQLSSASVSATSSVTDVAPSSTRLEAKLDDLVSLLRSQVVEKQAQQTTTPPNSNSTNHNTPSSTTFMAAYNESIDSAPPRDPKVMVDMTTDAVRFVRPSSPPTTSALILLDTLTYEIPESLAEEQLDTFRSGFLPMFPFVNLFNMSASELRHQKPFLWLVIMSLATKSITKQFIMEDMIWNIISRRIVSEHLVDLDLLLGVVCFASWSHYFKKEKPFMNMLTQLALSLTTELGVHKDARVNPPRMPAQFGSMHETRTFEERRTALAVFHLSSSTWTAYGKIEPLRWNRYLDDCLRVLGDTSDPMDQLLVTQIRCQLITHQLTCPRTEDSWREEDPKLPSAALTTALLRQIEDLRQGSLPLLRSEGPDQSISRSAQFYIENAKLTIQASVLVRPIAQDNVNLAELQALEDADATLRTIESWLAMFFGTPLSQLIGISVDHFAQFTHCLVVLFKLTTLERPYWNVEEVRRRADVFEVLDRAAETISSIPATLGIIDAEGPRRGLLFKTSYLLQAIKALFLTEMRRLEPQQQHQQLIPDAQNGSVEFGDEGYIPDELLASLLDEPWLSDILNPF
ncbi:hypothetical protein F4777DRAFT_543582 [Nemania sp. FL0916]|nr:hypothetical protein F4777DRAFT_543582 [Nemania sp. FL0916]